MTQSPVVFSFTTNSLRVVMRGDAPWFVAADVCAALGIGRTDDGVGRLDDDEKGTDSIRTPGGEQQMTIINESGLYSLILGSRKPEAKKFKKWVTSEVLPAIRKTGSYHAVPPTPTFDTAHEVLTAKDMGNLTRLVWLICNGLFGTAAWTQAVWFRLRQVAGVASPNRFGVRHLPILVGELRRIFVMTQAFKEAEREAERLLIGKVLRGGMPEGPALEEAKRRMLAALAENETAFAGQLASWEEDEFVALAERKQTAVYGEYLADYVEPKAV